MLMRLSIGFMGDGWRDWCRECEDGWMGFGCVDAISRDLGEWIV